MHTFPGIIDKEITSHDLSIVFERNLVRDMRSGGRGPVWAKGLRSGFLGSLLHKGLRSGREGLDFTCGLLGLSVTGL